jgi:D-alanyl-lipoteichoic acid acyltransferase DltB (MBOAT superfamily)
MTFDSLTFAVFLAIVFPVCSAAFVERTQEPAARRELRVLRLVEPVFLILLAFTTVFDWWAAQRIHAATSDTTRRRWFWASIIASLSLLGYFKYAQFFANTAIEWLALIGVTYKPARPRHRAAARHLVLYV